MQVDITILLGCTTVLFAVLSFYFSRKDKTHSDATQISTQATTVIVELQTVRRDISEMKAEIQAMRIEWREDHDKLVGMERDIKAIWRQVDKINGKDIDE